MRFWRVATALALCVTLTSPPASAQQAPAPQHEGGVEGRIVLELLGGMLGAMVGFFAIAYLTIGLCGDDCPPVFGGLAGAFFAMPLGVYLGGWLGGGHGTYGATLLGEIVGLFAAIIPTLWVLSVVTDDFPDEGEIAVGAAMIFAWPLGGTMAGYEISHDPDEVE